MPYKMSGRKPANKPKGIAGVKRVAGAKKVAAKMAKKQPKVFAHGRPWTNEEEETLAELWQSEPHMYDRATKDNKNDEMAEETLQSFCEKLNREAEDVATHMETLRSTYGRYCGKIARNELKIKTYRVKFIMDKFQFLDEHIIPRTYQLPSRAGTSTSHELPAKSTRTTRKQSKEKSEPAQDNTSNWDDDDDDDDDVPSQQAKGDPVGVEDEVEEEEEEKEKDMNNDDLGDGHDGVIESDGEDDTPNAQHTETGVGKEDEVEGDARTASVLLQDTDAKVQDRKPQGKEPDDRLEEESNKSMVSEQYCSDMTKLAKGRVVDCTGPTVEYLSDDNEHAHERKIGGEKVKKGDTKPSAEVGATRESDPTCPYMQPGKCCVELHVAQALAKMETEHDLNLTWGRLMGARVNEVPADVRGAFRLEMETLSYRATSGSWKPSQFF